MNTVSFQDIKDLKNLTIECHPGVQFIKCADTELQPLILMHAPEIQDTQFLWNIDDKLLGKMRNTQRNWVYYSDLFGNNCMCIEYMMWNKKIYLGFNLLRQPFNVKQHVLTIKWTVYHDNSEGIIQIHEQEPWTVNNREMWSDTGFVLEDLKDIRVLSFKIIKRIVMTAFSSSAFGSLHKTEEHGYTQVSTDSIQ